MLGQLLGRVLNETQARILLSPDRPNTGGRKVRPYGRLTTKNPQSVIRNLELLQKVSSTE